MHTVQMAAHLVEMYNLLTHTNRDIVNICIDLYVTLVTLAIIHMGLLCRCVFCHFNALHATVLFVVIY